MRKGPLWLLDKAHYLTENIHAAGFKKILAKITLHYTFCHHQLFKARSNLDSATSIYSASLENVTRNHPGRAHRADSPGCIATLWLSRWAWKALSKSARLFGISSKILLSSHGPKYTIKKCPSAAMWKITCELVYLTKKKFITSVCLQISDSALKTPCLESPLRDMQSSVIFLNVPTYKAVRRGGWNILCAWAYPR